MIPKNRLISGIVFIGPEGRDKIEQFHRTVLIVTENRKENIFEDCALYQEGYFLEQYLFGTFVLFVAHIFSHG